MVNHMIKAAVEEKIKQNQPVKLHLGCGPNIYEGWVNVEGDYCAGQEGIVIHNLTDPYPIADNSVDEILTVHVIEHILPGDIPAMFNEWRRILKPGGFVATEWPDLLKMCKFLVEDPSRIYTTSGKVRKRGVGGIFGDMTKYEDPAMLHKWGYSADSMSILYKEHGYSRVVIEDPKYKKTEMCSRVVAYK